MEPVSRQPIDRNGYVVNVGTRVRVLGLAGEWLQNLLPHEREQVAAMIGEIFEVEEIDEYGQPWVCKPWPNELEGTCHSQSVALESNEMESVAIPAVRLD